MLKLYTVYVINNGTQQGAILLGIRTEGFFGRIVVCQVATM